MLTRQLQKVEVTDETPESDRGSVSDHDKLQTLIMSTTQGTCAVLKEALATIVTTQAQLTEALDAVLAGLAYV